MRIDTLPFRKVRACLLCSSGAKKKAKAIVSPWAREFGINRSLTSNYWYCHVCEFGFFDLRYSDDEMKLLYRDYRGRVYQEIRNKWEHWYTPAFNSNHDSSVWIETRKDSLKRFLSEKLQHIPNSIVDVGGDRGQYIPDIGCKNLYVLEISQKELLNGVQRLNSLNLVEKNSLIIYSHVLEHVSDPLKALEELLEHSQSLYVEVPYGVPTINHARKSRILLLFKILASFNPRIWGKFTHPSTGRIGAKGTLIQIKHLSFFSVKSFLDLGNKLDKKVQVEVNEIQTPDYSVGRVIQCLFTNREES